MRVADKREIDDQAVIADPQPAGVVPAAPDGNEEAVRATEVDRRDDVGHIGAARDQGGSLVDHAVVDLACRFVALIAGLDEFAPQAGFQCAAIQFFHYHGRYSFSPCVNCSSSLLMVEWMKIVSNLARSSLKFRNESCSHRSCLSTWDPLIIPLAGLRPPFRRQKSSRTPRAPAGDFAPCTPFYEWMSELYLLTRTLVLL